jgi:hypothetical protein
LPHFGLLEQVFSGAAATGGLAWEASDPPQSFLAASTSSAGNGGQLPGHSSPILGHGLHPLLMMMVESNPNLAVHMSGVDENTLEDIDRPLTSPSTGPYLSSPSTSQTRKRRRETQGAKIAEAINNLGATYTRVQEMKRTQQPPEWTVTQNALSKLQEDPNIAEQDIVDATTLFQDGQKAVTFCSLSPAYRRAAWLDKELQLLRNAP